MWRIAYKLVLRFTLLLSALWSAERFSVVTIMTGGKPGLDALYPDHVGIFLLWVPVLFAMLLVLETVADIPVSAGTRSFSRKKTYNA